MAKMTFYGGVNEIGGNKILVETSDGNILLDFGRRLGLASEFYAEFLQLRARNVLRDMIRLELLPPLNGIYLPQFIDTTVRLEESGNVDKIPEDRASDYWKLADVTPYDSADPGVDGVFVSHGHFDHMQDVSFLNPDIPIYCSKETKILAKVITDVSVAKVDQQFYELRRKQNIIAKPDHYKT